METIEAQAMLIRYEMAIKQVPFLDQDERFALLADVLAPRAELLKISLAAAERQGCGKLARYMTRLKRTSKTLTSV